MDDRGQGDEQVRSTSLEASACVLSTIREWALQQPDAAAVRCGEQFTTYQELEDVSSRLAQVLLGQGMGPGRFAGVYLDRSVDMLIAIVGILKTGGAYVPLDPTYPQERLDFMIGDAGVTGVLTHQRLLDRLPNFQGEVLCLDAEREQILQAEPAPLVESVGSDRPAYVIYTSGSTGLPKGVAVSYRNLVFSTLARFAYYQRPVSRYLLLSSISFDSSVAGIFWSLCGGGSLIVPEPGAERDPAHLLRLIREWEITHLLCLPSLFGLLLTDERSQWLSSLETVIVAGEVCPPELVATHHRQLSTATLFNEYGPTEATVWSSVHACGPDNGSSVVPIGFPIPGARIHVVDDQLGSVPKGESGEICIEGPGITLGYLNQSEQTDAKFRDNPFADPLSAKVYLTGDVGRLLPDRTIEFLGRLDDQVKIRGYRIEVGEIENALRQSASVSDAAVLAREDVPGDKKLVAYTVCPAGRVAPSPADLRLFLGQHLPDYMIPSVFVDMETFPRMPNGKVDRRALPRPRTGRPILEENYVAPRTDLERRLTGMWGELLQIDKIGVNDRFFELGGDSLLAARFVGDIRKQLGEYIYTVTLFDSPTVASYATLLEKSYSQSVKGWLFPGIADDGAEGSSDDSTRKVDADVVERMRSYVPIFRSTQPTDEDEDKNSPVLFILSPPRSGTTLLRVMLAGHPDLFSATELNLLHFHTLEERREAFQGKFSAWLEGTIRTVMELESCDADAAKSWMEAEEKKGTTTKQFYRMLQARIGDRTLVDKTPSYALDPAALLAAEREFDQPLFIHLVRHPHPMIRSFEKMHMDQVLHLKEHSLTCRQLGELVWTLSHLNILQFLQGVPQKRQFRMNFEHLTHRPLEIMTEMCDSLGLPFHADLLEPYEDRAKKMTDGIYPESTPMGDIRFLEHKGIDPSVADQWRQVVEDDFLGDVTWELAQTLGYERLRPKPSTGETAQAAIQHRKSRRRERAKRRSQVRQSE